MMFAAGFGTRMGALTEDRPKPLIEVAGRPLIDHALALVQEVQPRGVVVNLHYKAEMLEQHLSGTGVATIREQPDILDTGGGLRNALPLLGPEPVLTTNTDAIWVGPNPMELLLKAWDPSRMDALLICVPTGQAHGHKGAGDFTIGPDGQLSRKGNTVYGGVQIMRTDLLRDIAKTSFSLNLIWNKMAESHRLFGLEYPGQWCDVGHPEGIAEAEAMLAQANV
jgi:MurNAc alpha-1-phosphate uridylyltransferase